MSRRDQWVDRSRDLELVGAGIDEHAQREVIRSAHELAMRSAEHGALREQVHGRIVIAIERSRLAAFRDLIDRFMSEARTVGGRSNPDAVYQVATGAAAGIDGGLWPIAGGEGHSMVQLFVRVDDVTAHVVRAKELGATIVIPPQVLPGGDEMAVAVDPDGIPFAMFKGRGAFPS
jgi:predicted enzyme related to lactoylglutathione lyase